MRIKTHAAFLAATLMALAACSTAPERQSTATPPTTEQMRGALSEMLEDRTDIRQEFKDAVKYARPVQRQGMVMLADWNCDPRAQSFEAAFAAPSVTLYQINGRFQQDSRGKWHAIVRAVTTTGTQDVGEYWRASQVDVRAN